MATESPESLNREAMKDLQGAQSMLFEKASTYTKLIFRIGVRWLLCVLVWNEAVPCTETARLVRSIGDNFADALRFVRGLQCGGPIPPGN